jgi:hypothetical protein
MSKEIYLIVNHRNLNKSIITAWITTYGNSHMLYTMIPFFNPLQKHYIPLGKGEPQIYTRQVESMP